MFPAPTKKTIPFNTFKCLALWAVPFFSLFLQYLPGTKPSEESPKNDPYSETDFLSSLNPHPTQWKSFNPRGFIDISGLLFFRENLLIPLLKSRGKVPGLLRKVKLHGASCLMDGRIL